MGKSRSRGEPTFLTKWIVDLNGKYALRAAIFSGLSVVSPVALTLSFMGELPWPVLVGLSISTVLFAGLATLFRNANKHEVRSDERIDVDELLDAMEDSLERVHHAARAHPDEAATIGYVDVVVKQLRKRLEPDGTEGNVRVCVYRRDDQDRQEVHDGDDASDGASCDDPVTIFRRYRFDSGRMLRKPRSCFQDDEAPGSTFIPELMRDGIHSCPNPKTFPSDPHYPGQQQPKYKSFVNLALVDGEDPFEDSVSAMVTCDSLDPDFFTERRLRVIRVFSHLIRLALTHETTDATVTRPEGLR